MLNQGTTDHNDNSTLKNKAETTTEPVAKANLGSNTSHLASLLKPIKTSAADGNKKDTEEKEKDSDTEWYEEVKKIEAEDAEEEVEMEAKVEKEKGAKK